jgi:hypothetical protein
MLTTPAFFMVGSHAKWNGQDCQVSPNYTEAYHTWLLIVIIVGDLILPSVIVAIFTGLIIATLMKTHQQLTMSSDSQVSNQSNRKDNQPTIALLAVAIAFIVLRTPYIIAYTIYANSSKLFSGRDDWRTWRLQVSKDVTFTIAIINYAINFFLYVITGKQFREEFKKFILCKRSDTRRSSSGNEQMQMKVRKNDNSSSTSNTQVYTPISSA